jgi:WD40 repeat protein
VRCVSVPTCGSAVCERQTVLSTVVAVQYRVWNTKTWKEMWSLTTHIGSVFALDVSSDTTALVSGGQDGIIRVCVRAMLRSH